MRRSRSGSVRLRRQPRHVFDRHLDAQRELLLLGGVDDRDGSIRDRLVRARQLLAAVPLRPSWRGARSAPSLVRRERDVPLDAAPPRNRATSSSGRCVAERPMRCSGPRIRMPRSASSRSSDSARCAPRLPGTSAWISSMMTVSTEVSRSRAFDVSSRNSDSGVVIRMSAACAPEPRALERRRVAGANGDLRNGDRQIVCTCDARRCRRAARGGCARRPPPAP